MTNKEALEILYKGIAPNPTANNECIKLCKAALEKQIPKKPNERMAGYKSFDYVCPECRRCIISKIDGEWIAGTHSRYCELCGQALDWSDTE